MPMNLDELLAFLKTARNVVPYLQVAEGNAMPGSIAMRHDIDHDLDKALACAEWEYKHGFRSSYYILHSAPYYQDRDTMLTKVKRIAELGHEIGIHNDALCSTDNDLADAFTLIDKELIFFDNNGIDIEGIADHGGSPHSNSALWDSYLPKDLGLKYEAYQLQKSTTTNTYISDNQGQWRSPLVFPQVFMLVHPIWWF